MSDLLKQTIGDLEWIKEHEDEIRAMLPDTWTHIHNLNGLKLGFSMKLLGIDWRSEDEFAKVLMFFEKIGILQRQNGYQVRGNHRSIFV